MAVYRVCDRICGAGSSSVARGAGNYSPPWCKEKKKEGKKRAFSASTRFNSSGIGA